MEKWLSPPLIVAIVALGISALNSYYTRKRDQSDDWKQELQKLQNDFDELCEDQKQDAEARINMAGDLRVLNKQMDVFWKTVEQQMAKKYQDRDEQRNDTHRR